MVEEIVYTSAEKGLKQGSRGFCTVVSTAGMSLALAERLESMSGYRHAFPLHDPQASMNPVCFSHVTTRLAGKTLHVISRVADAGQDYTGRSNKLAHHLVIDNVASMPAGPARLMAEPGVIVERWDGNVRNVPPRELRCAPLPASIPLVAWQSLTGDEGWAGSVAEQLLQNPAPVSIIFKPGTDTLTLVREALDLIPAPQRWNVTFSTYFTRLLAGAECQLRFVLNDTPEATSLRNDVRARVIDLTSSLPAATGGTLVAMARKGQLTPQEPAPAPTAPVVRSRTSVEISTKDTGAEISIPKLKPGLSPLENPDKPQPPREIPPPVRINSRKGLWIGLTVAVLLVAVTGVLIFQRSGKTQDPFADLMSKTVPGNHAPIETEETKLARETAELERRQLENREQEEKQAAVNEATRIANEKKNAADKLAASQQAERLRQEAMDAQAKAALEAAMRKDGPFCFVETDKRWHDENGQWLFELPLPASQLGLDTQRDSAMPLKLMGDESLEDVEVSLCDTASSLFRATNIKLKLNVAQREPVADSKLWVVDAEGDEIAEYCLKRIAPTQAADGEANYRLEFRWLKAAKREADAAEILRWWPLQVTVKNRCAVFLQRKAFRPTKALSWGGLTDKQRFQFPIGPDVRCLRLNDNSELVLNLSVQQPNEQDQILNLPLIKDKVAASTASTDATSKNGNTAHYFLLDLPLRFHVDRPKIEDDLIAFGTIAIAPQIDPDNGLSFRSALDIHVRIPKKENIATLPSFRLIGALETLAQQPDTFPVLAGQIDATNCDATNWPLLQQKYDVAMGEMKDNAAAMQGIEYWHSQDLQQSLPDQTEFTSPFNERAEDAKLAVRNVIQNLETMRQNAIGLEQTQIAERRLNALKPYASAIGRYVILLDQAKKRVDDQISELLKYHQPVKSRLDGFVKGSSKFRIVCTLFKSVDLPNNCENGRSITIYIMNSDSNAIQ